MKILRNEFLSDEDLDLRNMSQDELFAYWDLWLEQAQASNDLDRNTYSHGVFVLEPSFRNTVSRVAEKRASYDNSGKKHGR